MPIRSEVPSCVSTLSRHCQSRVACHHKSEKECWTAVNQSGKAVSGGAGAQLGWVLLVDSMGSSKTIHLLAGIS